MTVSPRSVRRPLVAAGGLLLLTALAACGNDTTAASAPDSADATPTGVSCTYTSEGSAAKPVDLPPDSAAVTGQVAVTIDTSAGPVDAMLDADAAPCTVSSFVSLAEQGYFDDTPCHRLTTQGIFVLQCGDPTGSGSGGPGYSYPDELDGQEKYPAGTLAMANAGADTNGSQFFIVYADTRLPPSYTVFGNVGADGLAAVESVAEKGVAGGGSDGPPATPVQITQVSVVG